jgi:hypothetical protein
MSRANGTSNATRRGKGIPQRSRFGLDPPSTRRPSAREGAALQAITVRDRDAGVGGLSLTDMPYPQAAQNDVIVRVHAAGFIPGELDWSGTWVLRYGGPQPRSPSG